MLTRLLDAVRGTAKCRQCDNRRVPSVMGANGLCEWCDLNRALSETMAAIQAAPDDDDPAYLGGGAAAPPGSVAQTFHGGYWTTGEHDGYGSPVSSVSFATTAGDFPAPAPGPRPPAPAIPAPTVLDGPRAIRIRDEE